MQVVIIPDNQATESKHGIPRKRLREMQSRFLSSPSGGRDQHGNQQETTKYAHFPIKNIMELLVVNEIVKLNTTIGDASKIEDFAIRVFFAQHIDKDDCPENLPAGIDYVGRNTVVLVNAKHVSGDEWENMLDYKSAEIPGYSVNAGEGSDKTNLCPPQCSPPTL
ncbi:MAG: hypothetical protein LCH51_03315 [Bacteroidetes bacterium]|nr:hypothetical protein [Bacteroidota bacterium]